MSSISIQIPDSLKKHVERLAASDGISVEAFLKVLAKVPAAEPGEWDRLP